MEKVSREDAEREGDTFRELLGRAPDVLSDRLRSMVSEFIVTLVAAELDEALGANRYERLQAVESRHGYRHGHRPRVLTTSLGTDEIKVPRARLFTEGGGSTREWSSQLLPRYSRRTSRVDGAMLMSFLSGANQRRIEKALKPMLGGQAALSKSAVSRVVQQMRRSYDQWSRRRLDERYVYVFLDAIVARVRVAGRVEKMPVLVALGVKASGEKEVLSLQLMALECTAAWRGFVEDLNSRGLKEPILCVIDGNAGLRRAVAEVWPQAQVQRCLVHKLRNLEAHCPKRLAKELRHDFRAISTARSEKGARTAFDRFVHLWRDRSEGVVKSLLEAGSELLTFYGFPKQQWKSLRTTNSIERLNGEFRRRLKTQASFPAEASVLQLLYGLCAGGEIHLRCLDGWQHIAEVIQKRRPEWLRTAA